jgi:hypothetical protein
MVCMVPKVGNLVACWKDSWFCDGAGDGLLGSIFHWVV